MPLNELQQKIVDTTANKVVVIASAGSGKTTTMIERLRHLLVIGEDPSKIVCITFTNAAAEEITSRIGDSGGIFIGTIHSYCNYLLKSIGVNTSALIEKEEFDELFRLIKRHPQAIQPVRHLLLDEAQDSSQIQLDFILDMINPENYVLIGDPRQSIYRFNMAYPERLIELSKDSEVETHILNTNYRCSKKTLRFARYIIKMNGPDYFDTSKSMTGQVGRVIETRYSPATVARAIKNDGNYGDWFVLCRTNTQVSDMCFALRREGVPVDTFKRAELDTNEFNQRMKSDTVKVLTIHTAKGLESKKVVVIGAKQNDVEETCVSYVAATRAKELLVWTYFRNQKKIEWGE